MPERFSEIAFSDKRRAFLQGLWPRMADLIDTVFFDWDGTLVDTAWTAFEAFQKSLAELGIRVDYSLYERVYSPNWHRMYQFLKLPGEKWMEADNLWLHYYGQQIPKMVPGAREALAALSTEDFSLGIVTSGSRARVRREMEAHAIGGFFQAVVCDEDVTHKKPHPQGLQMALSRLNKKPQMCCYVGDCPEDMEMGKQAGVMTIAIPGSFPRRHSVLDSVPDAILESIFQLPECLRRMRTGERLPSQS